jgi:maltose alpha-D-glucosyltransferase/alpha-amylase
MGDKIELPDRHGVRTPMQWDDSPSAGFSAADPAAFYNPLVDSPDYAPDVVNVAAQRRDPTSLLWAIRHMIGVRKAHPALGRGDLRFLEVDNPHILAILRVHESETILAIHNLTGSVQQVELDLSSYRGQQPLDVLSSTLYHTVEDEPYYIELTPFAYRWLSL